MVMLRTFLRHLESPLPACFPCYLINGDIAIATDGSWRLVTEVIRFKEEKDLETFVKEKPSIGSRPKGFWS